MSDQFAEIEQRFIGHIVSYSNPGTSETCWMAYRLAGDCGCNAEADMQWLLDRVRDLEHDNRGLAETIGEWQEIHGTFASDKAS